MGTSFTIGAKTFSTLSRSCAGLHMSWKPYTRRARWTRADLRICHLRCERKAHKKVSKLESQPRTHKGATREANTTATQNSAPLSTGLSMMFETLTIYPGHLKGLHDHTSRLRFQKIQPWLNTTSWGAPNATPWPYIKQLHSYFKQRTDTNRQIKEKNKEKQQIEQ